MKTKTALALTLAAIMAIAGLPGPAGAQTDDPAGPVFEEGFVDGDGWGPGPGFRGHRGMGYRMIGPGGPGGRGPHALRFALKNLDLSEAQWDDIKALFENERDQLESFHEQMRTLGSELMEQIESDPYDEETVRAKATALAELQVEIAVLRARRSGRIRKILSPEQLSQLEDMKNQRRSFRKQHHERFREKRRGQ